MKVELRWESRNTIPKSLHPQWAFHLFTFTPNITSLPKKLRAATHLNMPAFPLRRSWNVNVKSFSRVWLFATLWTVAYQDPLFMGFIRQEYWSGLPLPSPGHLPYPGIKPRSPTLRADTLPSEPPGKTLRVSYCLINPHFAFLISLSCLWILSVKRLNLLSSINYTMSK